MCSKMVALSGLMSFLSACAFVDTKITPPNVTPKVITQRPVKVWVGPVAWTGKRIGCKKNGFDIETANVYLSVPVGTWWRIAVRQALQASGHRVVSPKKAHIWIRFTLDNLFMEPHKSRLYGILSCTVTARTYSAMGKRKLVAVASVDRMGHPSSTYRSLLTKLVSSWTTQLVAALDELGRKAPQTVLPGSR